MALISNIGLLTAYALTGEPKEKDPTFNKEPSPNNGEVSSLVLIPPPNGAGTFNDIGGEKLYDAKEVFLVGQTDIESMLDEIGFVAANEIGRFTLDKGPKVS